MLISSFYCKVECFKEKEILRNENGFVNVTLIILESGPGQERSKVNEHFKSLKCILGAFMLRRTKLKLIECGNLVLPPLTELTVYVF